MPTWVSVHGKWEPAQERSRAVNKSGKEIEIDGDIVEPGEDFIYKGPDRGALDVLAEKGVKSLGENPAENPDVIEHIRRLGYKTFEEYAEAKGVDIEGEKTKAKEVLKKQVNKNKKPNRVKSSLPTGNESVSTAEELNGGFGNTPS